MVLRLTPPADAKAALPVSCPAEVTVSPPEPAEIAPRLVTWLLLMFTKPVAPDVADTAPVNLLPAEDTSTLPPVAVSNVVPATCMVPAVLPPPAAAVCVMLPAAMALKLPFWRLMSVLFAWVMLPPEFRFRPPWKANTLALRLMSFAASRVRVLLENQPMSEATVILPSWEPPVPVVTCTFAVDSALVMVLTLMTELSVLAVRLPPVFSPLAEIVRLNGSSSKVPVWPSAAVVVRSTVPVKPSRRLPDTSAKPPSRRPVLTRVVGTGVLLGPVGAPGAGRPAGSLPSARAEYGSAEADVPLPLVEPCTGAGAAVISSTGSALDGSVLDDRSDRTADAPAPLALMLPWKSVWPSAQTITRPPLPDTVASAAMRAPLSTRVCKAFGTSAFWPW